MKHALEILEQKTGKIHTTDDHQRAVEKSLTTPGELSDEQILVIDFFTGPAQAAVARAAREKALGRTVDPPAAVTTPVEFPATLWDQEAPDQVQEMERWSVAHAMKALPLIFWWKFVNAGRVKRESLEVRIAALEKQVEAPSTPLLRNLEHRVRAIEGREYLHIKYLGAWYSGRRADKDDFCSHRGQLWVAVTTKSQAPEPGTDDGDTWVLASGAFSPTHELKLATLSACDQDLTARVRALESRPQTKYCGVWNEGTDYTAGSFVTYKGSVWHGNAGSKAIRPGTCDVWTLAVKSGRDAR